MSTYTAYSGNQSLSPSQDAALENRSTTHSVPSDSPEQLERQTNEVEDLPLQELTIEKGDNDVFTFVTVYYKHGDWGVETFNTLREGLLHFALDYSAREMEKGEALLDLDDDTLIDRVLDIGHERIERQIGHGLVAIVKGPARRIPSIDEPTVFLEMYYKHGEWNLSQNGSRYIDDAMMDLERELRGEWDDLSPKEQFDEAMERSVQNVEYQRGWGVVTGIAGTILAEGEP